MLCASFFAYAGNLTPRHQRFTDVQIKVPCMQCSWEAYYWDASVRFLDTYLSLSGASTPVSFLLPVRSDGHCFALGNHDLLELLLQSEMKPFSAARNLRSLNSHKSPNPEHT